MADPARRSDSDALAAVLATRRTVAWGLVWAFFMLGLMALWLANIVLIIIASIKASGGETYRYPLTIRLIS